ncbi:hypothetical protein GQX74_009040 [Glossina fuscipes]|nr:hypothetical protein GQX74_009040 [Glossina fuscipes]
MYNFWCIITQDLSPGGTTLNFTSYLNCLCDEVLLQIRELNQSLHVCWKLLLPQMVQRGRLVPSKEAEFNRIISVASNLGGDELSNMTINEVRELFEEQPSNEEELIEFLNTSGFHCADDSEIVCNTTTALHLILSDLKEGVPLAKKLENCFVERDSSVVRSGKFDLQDRNRQKSIEVNTRKSDISMGTGDYELRKCFNMF